MKMWNAISVSKNLVNRHDMGKIKKILAGAVAVALFAGLPGAAYAVPDAPALPNTYDAAEGVSPHRSKVFVTLKKQPKVPGGKGASLTQVENLADSLADKYGLEVDRTFGYLVNGFSAYVDTADISALKREAGVATVEKVRMYYPTMQSADDLTRSSHAATKYGLDGEGLVVSIIDTGIDIAHQDMRLDDGVTKKLTPAPGFTDKVPYGYNFADENGEVKDLTSSHHGMHVAGIVAANGGADADIQQNSRINGIAPNAQLLAMKVFSNDPAKSAGAAGDDIIAAIEESVKKGADIINMSLGSPNGHDGQAYGEQRAIAAARAAGVEVIVAAGNEGQNGSPTGTPDDVLGLWDDSTVGSPSTGTDAWSVASIENSTKANLQGEANGNNASERFVYDLQTGSNDGMPHQIVDGGYGTIDDMNNANPRGKWVLIQRGGYPGQDPLTFRDKFLNATIAGATGVILYNHANGGDEIPGMAGIDSFDVPGAAIGHSDGERIKALIQADANTTVTLHKRYVVEANPASLKPSEFTSWGASPELNFKPQIAGIGGNVYSTVNDDSYGNKSGTSMAAPHVAGVAALMLEKTTKDFPNKSRGELVLRNRIALSNTAMIPMASDTVPFAPRQIGAGLVQTEPALETRVLATVGEKPYAELKEVNGSESFTVTLTNESNRDITFDTGSTCVVNETNLADGSPTTTLCATGDSISASAANVTVPANGTAEVTYTLNVAAGNHWVEGWVKFASTDSAQPTLVLPYLGFAGNWNEEPIIDYPAYDGFNPSVLNTALGTTLTTTSLYTMINDGEMTLGDGEQYISPNDDGFADAIYAKLAMLRNAKRLTVAIVDEHDNVVRELGKNEDVSRFTVKNQLAERPNTFQVDLSDITFNGKVYDAATGEFVNVPDGVYYYRIQAQIADGFEPQTLHLPFGIDTVAPEVEVVSVTKNADGNYELKVRATDASSGVNAVQGRFTWPAVVASDPNAPVDNVYTITVNGTIADRVGYIEVYASDYATNVVRKTVMLNSGALVVESEETITSSPTINATATSDQTDELLVQDGQLILTGRASEQVAQIRIGQTVVDVPHTAEQAKELGITAPGRFRIGAPVVEGENTVVVEALDANGGVVTSKTYTFTYDGTAPVFELTSPTTDPVTPENGKIVVAGKVTDNLSQIREITIGWNRITVNDDGTFRAEVDVFPGQASISVTAYDGAWNRAVKVININDPSADKANLDLKANLGFNRSFNVISADNPDLSYDSATDTYTFTYSGKFNRVPDYFAVDGKQVTVAADGSFSVPLTIKQGISGFNLKIEDTTYAIDTGLKVFFDADAPGLDLTDPQINADGAIYLKEAGDVTFAGSVWDNAFGYALTLNGNLVENFLNTDDPTHVANKRDFSTKVPAKDGDKILLALYDQIDNAYLQLIPVIVDNVKPEVEFTGATNTAVVEPNTTISALVTDANLSSADFYLDGTQIAARAVELTPAAGAESLTKGNENAIDKDVAGKPTNSVNSLDTVSANQPSALAGIAARAAADANNVANTANDPAPAAPAANSAENHTLFTVTLNKPLEEGNHEFTVQATDKAGNVTNSALTFVVNKPPVIEGPDTLELDPALDEAARAQAIIDALTITDSHDDGDNNADTKVTTSVDVSALQVDTPVKVEVVARDSHNVTTTKEITVTLKHPERSVSNDGVSYTANMPADVELKVTRTDVEGGQNIEVSGAPLADSGKWVLTAEKPVSAIYFTDISGTKVKINFRLTDKGYEFTAPSEGTIELVYLVKPQLISPTTGIVTPPSGAFTKKGLAATGATLGGFFALSFGLIAAGTVLERRRRTQQ